MVNAARFGALLVFLCMLSACGEDTSFEAKNSFDNQDSDVSNSNASSSDPSNSSPPNSNTRIIDSNSDIQNFRNSSRPGLSSSQDSTANTQLSNSTPSSQSSTGVASAKISWDIPTTRENGENLTLSDIAGYEILYRKADEVVFNSITVEDQSQSERVVEGLTPGRYEFYVLVFDETGLYSDLSEPVIADISSANI